jgi:hypothetical protein
MVQSVLQALMQLQFIQIIVAVPAGPVIRIKRGKPASKRVVAQQFKLKLV